MSIQNDLQELVDKEFISDVQAANISQYYKTRKKSGTSVLTLVFSSLGAILLGLAIILILAHNWDEMSRVSKLIAAYAPLLISQVLAGYSIKMKQDETLWRETSGILLFFSLGSCLALIAQIYNIDDTEGNFFLLWTGLSIPIIYLLRSSVLSLLCISTITLYNFSYAFSTSLPDRDWYYFIFLAAILPYYINLLRNSPNSNTTYIHHWVLALSLTVSVAAVVYTASFIVFLLYVTLFTFFYNLGHSRYLNNTPAWSNAWSIIAQIGIFVVLVMLSFEPFWENISKEFNIEKMFFSREFLMTMIFGVAGLFLYFKEQIFKPTHMISFFLILLPFVLIYFLNDAYPHIFINLLTLALGITVIYQSIQEEKLAALNFGLLIISVLILSRFFDTDMSYLIRGIVFAALGAGFFITNYYMMRKFNKNENQ